MEIGGYLNKITTRVIIDSNGNNVWLAPAVFKSHCRMDIASFPFDQQNCNLKYGSWTYDGGRINLLAESAEGDLGKTLTTNLLIYSLLQPFLLLQLLLLLLA